MAERQERKARRGPETSLTFEAVRHPSLNTYQPTRRHRLPSFAPCRLLVPNHGRGVAAGFLHPTLIGFDLTGTRNRQTLVRD